MLKAIQNNPFRVLGVYANSPKRDIVSNKGRISAFLNVGREVSFPLDLQGIFPTIQRDADIVANADSELSLPAGQLKHGQFWFVKTTPIDDIAFNHLLNGNIDNAIEMWGKRQCMSSLQNRVVAYLIKEEYRQAISCAQELYDSYSDELVTTIAGDTYTCTSDDLIHHFIDKLLEEKAVDPMLLFEIISHLDWVTYLKGKLVEPLIKQLESAIGEAKDIEKQNAAANYQAGLRLINFAKNQLNQLKDLIPSTELQYQIIADKFGLQILQCGINYYNNSDDDDAAHKAMTLQRYAMSVVVGDMAKDRCSENVRTLENIISKLPPVEVMSEHKYIQDALRIFSLQPDLIEHSIQLIKKCVPYIISIKEKLGRKHQYYLRISTTIVNNALGNIIAEVNKAQEYDFEVLKKTLIRAWRTQLYMDKFDLDSQYQEGRYKDCRNSLHNIIENCKGFESSTVSFMYRYGCGWCNDLDVSDVDLRTDDEYFASCKTITLYESYLKNFPNGKHVSEANSKMELLKYQAAKTILDYQKFLNDYPNSNLRSKAQEAIDELIRKENERKLQLERLTMELKACSTTSEVINLYKAKKKIINEISNCSSRAFELARNEYDYQKIISEFGARSTGGQKAKAKIDEIERNRKEDAERRKKIVKWFLWTSIVITLLVGIYLIGGFAGLAVICYLIAGLAFFSALIFSHSDNGCALFLLLAAIGAFFAFIGSQLSSVADDIKRQKRQTELYEQILSTPSISLCEKFVESYYYSKPDQTDSVRSIWLNLLVEESKTYDYSSVLPLLDKPNKNPVQKIANFANENIGNAFYEKAIIQLAKICDSLYFVAEKQSTIAAWKQYQRIVPQTYLKDSENKIQEIENRNWNTEDKAWKTATNENTISAYNKYKELYPNGVHYAMAEKKIIDLEVATVYAGKHGTLPTMDKISYGNGPTSYITVKNSTSYTLTLLYSGVDSKRLVISAGQSSSIRLKNGSYRVAASVSAYNVRKYAGTENLNGGSYDVEYYISSQRF